MCAVFERYCGNAAAEVRDGRWTTPVPASCTLKPKDQTRTTARLVVRQRRYLRVRDSGVIARGVGTGVGWYDAKRVTP
jgi:hypothetical protein